MILVAYRHGLRAAELVDLRWDQVEFAAATLARPSGQAGHAQHAPHPRRRATGAAQAATRTGTQVAVRVHVGARRAVHHGRLCPHGRAGWRSWPSWASRPTRTCCATPAALRWPTRATTRARCKPTSGHRNIQHTVRYTELSPKRFKDFWRE